MGSCWSRFLEEWDRQRFEYEDFASGYWPFVFGAASNRCLTNACGYVVFKVLEALFVTGLLGCSLYKWWMIIDCGEKYPIYFTHWSLVLQVYYVWISLWATYHSSFPSTFSDGFEEMPLSVGATWVLSDILLPLTFFVSATYWLLIFPHQTGTPPTLTLLTHGGNFLIMVLDWFIARVPYYLLHGVYYAALSATYIIFTLFYWAFKGRDCSGNLFILKDLDWNHPEKVGTIQGLAFFVFFPILNLVFWFVMSQLCPSVYRMLDEEGGSGWLEGHPRERTGRKRGMNCAMCCAK